MKFWELPTRFVASNSLSLVQILVYQLQSKYHSIRDHSWYVPLTPERTATSSSVITDYPIKIGASFVLIDGILLVMGGGAVCFSFGTYWNRGCYTINLSERCSESHTFEFKETRLAVTEGVRKPLADRSSRRAMISIPRINIHSSDEFNKILTSNIPIIIQGMNIGCCVEKWTTAYLKQKIGPSTEVSNNFRYSRPIYIDIIRSLFMKLHQYT